MHNYKIPLFQRVADNWPMFAAWILMVGWSSLTRNPYHRWFDIFLQAYLFTALASTGKWVKRPMYLLLFLLFFAERVIEWGFGLNISPTTLTLLAETTPRESGEFLSLLPSMPSFWLAVVVTGLLGWGGWLAERRRMPVAEKLKASLPAKLITVIFLGVGIFTAWNYKDFVTSKTLDELEQKWSVKHRNPDDMMTRIAESLYSVHLAEKEMKNVFEITSNVEKGRVSDGFTGVKVVLVVGESFIRQHSPLYGYPLNTTPMLVREQAAGRLTTFTDVVSPYRFTTAAMRNIISCNSMSAGQIWSELPPLTAVFKHSGYKVTMYDNQRTWSKNTLFSFTLNNYLFDSRIADKCYDAFNDSCFKYDDDIVDYFIRKEKIGRGCELAVFHLMGQHFNAIERYPAQFAYFTSDSISWRREPWMTDGKRQEIAEYDNAVRYNDYVLGRIFNIFKDEKAAVVFLSDHGEEIYDYRDSKGRKHNSTDLQNMMTYQFAIPMTVWCSDAYRSAFPGIAEALSKSASRPMMSDDTPQLLFHLAGLQTPYYNHRRDILSDDYIQPHRLLEDQFEY